MPLKGDSRNFTVSSAHPLPSPTVLAPVKPKRYGTVTRPEPSEHSGTRGGNRHVRCLVRQRRRCEPFHTFVCSQSDRQLPRVSADRQLSAFVLPCWPALSPSPCSWVTWLVLRGPWQFKHSRHWCHPFHHILTTRIMWTGVWFFLILLRCRVPLAATSIVLPMGLFLSSK